MIYDCFVFFNEFDILDVRLHEMSSVVDRFVLVEATKTFTGKPKPLHFAENKERFAPFLDRITHIVVEFPENLRTNYNPHQISPAWAREHYQRDQISRGLAEARSDDIIIVSDVDEIISADKLRKAFRLRRHGDLTVFTMPHFLNFVNRRVRDVVWTLGPRMIEYRYFPGAERLRLTKFKRGRSEQNIWAKLRNIERRVMLRVYNGTRYGVPNRIIEIPDAGWHFTSIGDWQNFREKILAYSHEERKETPEFTDVNEFERHMLSITTAVSESELPYFIRTNLNAFPVYR